MRLDTQLIENLQQLFQQEPSLVRELTNADNLDRAIDRIAVAAERHGIPFDAAQRDALSAEVAAYLQPQSEAYGVRELNEEALSGVSGGIMGLIYTTNLITNAIISLINEHICKCKKGS
jgi:hypothetical protein